MLENLDRCSPSIVGETANGKKSNARDLASMSVDELWALRESIDAILAAKISVELNDLRRQLDRLNPKAADQHSLRKRSKVAVQKQRSHRSVLPKYQNPTKPFETWTGRGRRPHWLRDQLISGKPLEDFRIP